MLYALIVLCLIVEVFNIWKDSVWKGKVLRELQDIHICTFSANQCQQQLLRLSQDVTDEHFPVYYDVLRDYTEKVSDR